MEDQTWSKEDLTKHIKANVEDYSSATIVAALYKKLYGEFPDIGLSGWQAEYADKMLKLMPESNIYAKGWWDAMSDCREHGIETKPNPKAEIIKNPETPTCEYCKEPMYKLFFCPNHSPVQNKNLEPLDKKEVYDALCEPYCYKNCCTVVNTDIIEQQAGVICERFGTPQKNKTVSVEEIRALIKDCSTLYDNHGVYAEHLHPSVFNNLAQSIHALITEDK